MVMFCSVIVMFGALFYVFSFLVEPRRSTDRRYTEKIELAMDLSYKTQELNARHQRYVDCCMSINYLHGGPLLRYWRACCVYYYKVRAERFADYILRHCVTLEERVDHLRNQLMQMQACGSITSPSRLSHEILVELNQSPDGAHLEHLEDLYRRAQKTPSMSSVPLDYAVSA